MVTPLVVLVSTSVQTVSPGRGILTSAGTNWASHAACSSALMWVSGLSDEWAGAALQTTCLDVGINHRSTC